MLALVLRGRMGTGKENRQRPWGQPRSTAWAAVGLAMPSAIGADRALSSSDLRGTQLGAGKHRAHRGRGTEASTGAGLDRLRASTFPGTIVAAERRAGGVPARPAWCRTSWSALIASGAHRPLFGDPAADGGSRR